MTELERFFKLYEMNRRTWSPQYGYTYYGKLAWVWYRLTHRSNGNA